MALGVQATPEQAASLRKMTRLPELDEIIVYDADFPQEAGQQFVSALLVVIPGQQQVGYNLLTDPKGISDLIHEIAAEHGQTVKFWIKLPPADYPSLPIEAEVAEDLPAPPAQRLDFSGEDWARTNNTIRATWAGEALKVFARRVGTLTSEELDTVLQDLLVDLMHLADALQQGGGLERSFDEVLERARRCHEEERRGEP